METIHILQKTYELLYVARIPLLNYLSERLPAISSTWKRDCVERVLNEKNNRDFSELDIYYLILILQDRENQSRILEMFPQDKLIYKDNSKLFLTIRDLRCEIMHPSFANYTFEDFMQDNPHIQNDLFSEKLKEDRDWELLNARIKENEKWRTETRLYKILSNYRTKQNLSMHNHEKNCTGHFTVSIFRRKDSLNTENESIFIFTKK